MRESINRCECCGRVLKPGTERWLELSLSDGYYYWCLPAEMESQGGFPFGAGCAAKIARDQPRKNGPLHGAKKIPGSRGNSFPAPDK